MTDTPQDVFTMTPEQATAELDRMAQDFRGPPPSATPTTPAEAAARLRQLTADPKWRDSYLAGSVAQRREFTQLTEMAAGGGEAPDLSIEVVDSVSDPHAMPRARYDGLIEALRENGMPDTAEQYIRDLDSGARTDRPTAGDGAAAQAALNRLTKDPAFGKKYLSGDIAAQDLMNGLSRIISYAGDDGQPVTPALQEQLSAMFAAYGLGLLKRE